MSTDRELEGDVRGARARLAPWLLAFVLVRLVVLLCEWPALHRIDELYAGAAAIELGQGRGLPLAELAWDRYAGGSLLVIGLARATFALLGPSAFALKLVALACSSATLALWLALLRRLCGARAMRFSALLFVLGPIEFARLGWMAWGNHGESALPGTAALLAALHLIADQPARWPRPALAVACGLAAGGALFCSAIAVIYLAALAVILVLGWRLLSGRDLAGILAGFLMGVLPSLLLQRALRFAGVQELMPVLSPEPGQMLARAIDVAARGLRHYLAPQLGLPPVLEGLFWLAVMLALAASFARLLLGLGRRQPEVSDALLCAGPLAFLAAYALSGFYVAPAATGIIAYRYLAPVTPFLLAALGVALARLPPLPARAALALLCALNLLELASRLPAARTDVFRAPGASYFAYGWHVYDAAGRDPGAAAALVRRIDRPDRRRAALDGMARTHATLAFAGAPAGQATLTTIETFAASIAGTAPDEGIFAERLGGVLAGRWSVDGAELERALALAERLGPAIGGPVLRSALEALGRQGSEPDAALLARVASLPLPLRPFGFEALGALAARGRGGLGEGDPIAFERGYGRGVVFARLAASRDAARGRDRPVRAPLPGRAAACAREQGIEQALRWIEPDDPERRAALRARLDPGPRALDCASDPAGEGLD